VRGIAFVIALAGCTTSDLNFGGTMFRCDDGVTCPSGFSCVAGFCRGMVDAPVVDAPPACGKIAAFNDNFDLNSVDTVIWNLNSGSINETGGAAVATISPGVANMVSEFGTSQRAELTSSQVYIEVLQTTAETFLRVQSDDTHFLEIAVAQGALSFKQDGGLVGSPIGYNNVMHRWWRISERGNMVSFDTSLDGNAWMSQASTATPGYAASVTLHFGARTGSPQSSGGEAHFENLNGGLGPPAGPCVGGG
jgi:hypothetical protein